MKRTTKRAKMPRGNKENEKPLKLVKKSEEKRRAKKYVLLTKRRHVNAGDARNRREPISVENLSVRVRNKPVKCAVKKARKLEKTVQPSAPDKVEEGNAKAWASPAEYLDRIMHKSLHKVPLTRAELQHLFAKYKSDGHYRIEGSSPSFTGVLENSINEPNAASHSLNQTQFSPGECEHNSAHRCKWWPVESATDLPVHVNDAGNTGINTFAQGNRMNESYRGSWHNPTPQYDNNCDPLYIDENPHDLSNRTSWCSASDSNTVLNASSFGSERSTQGLENPIRNGSNDYEHLRNHDFIESYIPPLNPTFFDTNTDCPNADNNMLVTSNKDNGLMDKLYNVITQMWENKPSSQISPAVNIETYYNRKLNTNNALVYQLQDSTFMENRFGQNSAAYTDNNANHTSQVKSHFYIPYNNGINVNNNYSNPVL